MASILKVTRSTNVPQASSLYRIRAVVDAIVEGDRSVQQIAKRTHLEPRQVSYALHSARVLGWLRFDESGCWLSDAGAHFLASAPDTGEEQLRFRQAIEQSSYLAEFAQGLVSPKELSVELLARQLARYAPLSKNTAARRAQTLLSWRSQALGAVAPSRQQLTLPIIEVLPQKSLTSPPSSVEPRSLMLNADLEKRLAQAFRPHAPIEDNDSFQGRELERQRVESALAQPGLHAVIYGERGAGKTSLANVATSSVLRLRIFCERRTSFAGLCRNIVVEHLKTSPPGLVFDATSNSIHFHGNTYDVDHLNGTSLRALLPVSDELCIVLDEVDRIGSPETIMQVAELCKNLSTYQSNITVVLVGVAETADDLLRGHASNVRNLKQVGLGRMKRDELTAILRHGESILRITFPKSVEDRILDICDLFPYYLHLIAVDAARETLKRAGTEVSIGDFEKGIEAAALDCDESLRSVYQTAILSVKHSEIYRLTLWALSDMEASVSPVSTIAERVNELAANEGEKMVSTQAVGQAIQRLMTKEKKVILSNRDKAFYGFTNPLMRGYIRLVRERA